MLSYQKQASSEFPQSRWIAVVVAAAIVTGCGRGMLGHDDALGNEKLKPVEVPARTVPLGLHEGESRVLRLQEDRARERGWILTRLGVYVFDLKTRQTTRFVPLPDWLWAGAEYSCTPDLALGPKGEAVVSSNVVPTLWRIDPETLAVSKHDLDVGADADKDVGFTGLAYSPKEDAFFGVSDFGALWRIDPLFKRARQIPLSAPIPKACGVAVRATLSRLSLGLCVRGQRGDWTVNLTRDRRSGYVVAQPCPAVQPPDMAVGGLPLQKGERVSLVAATSLP